MRSSCFDFVELEKQRSLLGFWKKTMAQKQQLTPEQVEQLKRKLESMSPEEVQEMVKQQCIFCKIVAGEIPNYTVYEDKKVMAFLDIQPATTGHVIVIPKKHYSVLPQMPDDDVAYLFAVAKQLSGVVFDTTGAQGVTLQQNNGAAAGQTVPHVHVHIIPRFPDDKLNLEWKPQKMDEKQFAAVQSSIASKAKGLKIRLAKASAAPVPKPVITKTTKTKTKSKPKTKRNKRLVRLVKP